ncbi:MAG: MBL fold metallo-hydrolase [Dysgonomonas sp.]
MKLTYIFHSGFAIESDNLTIIIDYYKDSADDGHGVVHEKLLNNAGKIYVLSSHSHFDHFNPEILTWKKIRPDIKYIFSKDILTEHLAEVGDATFIDKLDTFEDNHLKIKAFGSTDIGISFYMELQGKQIFHAGDLNNWHWNEESTPQEIEEATNYYLTELNLLAENVHHLDLAMFPVDPRLGKDYMLGAKQFLDKIKTDLFTPMHFGLNYDQANAIETYAHKNGVQFFKITEKGQTIDF